MTELSNAMLTQEPPLPTLRPEPPRNSAFEFSGDPAKFWPAFAQAQAAFQPVLKSKTVTVSPKTRQDGSKPNSYTFDYAPLDEVLGKTLPALNSNGFALIQPMYGGATKTLCTMLTHSSGVLTLKVEIPNSQDIQAVGSSITYLRRYSVSCLLGIASEEDDDGNAADGNERKLEPRKAATRDKPPEAPPKPASMSQALKKQILDLSKDAGFTVEELKVFASRQDVNLDNTDENGGIKVLKALEALKVKR